MKKLLLITAAIVATSGAFAKKVKFRVDMTGKTLSTNGLHIAGDFQAKAGAPGDWNPSATTLTQEGTTNWYSVIVTIPAKAKYEFKFINDNNWGAGEEAIPAESQVGGGNTNRWIYIDSTANDTTMLNYKFASNAPTNMRAMRLKVDMAKVASVSPEGVFVAGAFQGWSAGKTAMIKLDATKMIYEYIAIVDSTEIEYKFLNGTGGWESTAGACIKNGNRFMPAGKTTTVLGVVCFNSCTACPSAPIPTYKVTLSVDVKRICGVDSVDVAGGLLPGGWGTGSPMMKVGTTQVYGTQIMSIDSGSNLQFKYRYYKGGVQNWEQIASPSGNREIKITKDTVLALNCFSKLSSCSDNPAPQKITFKVDMKNEVPNGNVYLVLDYKGDAKTGAIRMTPKVGFPTVFETTVNNVCNGDVYYYFMNGDSSVSGNNEKFPDTLDRACTKPNGVGGFNRELVRTVGTDATYFVYFNSCKSSTTRVEEVAVLAQSMRLYPNPTSTFTVVEFNDNANSHNVQVMDIAGRVVRTYSDYKFNALKVEKEELTPGIYFINVTNDKNQNGSIKLLID